MDLETVALLAELRFKVLEATVMLKNGCSSEEVIKHLIETAESINHTYQINKE
jgi:fatty acid-binding protein DegV